MDAENYIQMMIDSLKMKERMLQEIVNINEKQSALAVAVDFDEDKFHESIEEKGNLIENLIKLDEGFNSLYTRIKPEIENNRTQYSAEIELMKQLIKSVTELGVQVQAQEARNKDQVQNRFNIMRKELQNAKRSTKMANTYYKNQKKLDYEPQFMDWKQ